MFQGFLARDRMVMAGLIVLGIATVAAGFVSGRSTFQYALSTDARQAAAKWVAKAEDQLFRQQLPPGGRVLDQGIAIVAPGPFNEYRARAGSASPRILRVARLANEESGLLAGIDKLFSGWISKLTSLLDAEDHVSQIRNFALLQPDGTLVMRSKGFEPAALDKFLAETRFRAELYKSLGMYTTRIFDKFAMPGQTAGEFQKGVIVPLLRGRKISRVYVLSIDQSSAATMSKVALVAASMMTSLLIVLGYSVPAAIAFRRIRERWKAEDQIRFLAMHDPLTGLPNRVQWQNALEQALARAKRRDSLLAVMCIDLDRFKEINDTLGHKAGDTLLRKASDRLRGCVRETDVVARLGGDEFAIIAEDLEVPADAIPLARRICYQLARSYDIDGHELAISGSVGITLAPAEGAGPEELLNNADLALYRAKNDGRNTFRFFEPEMDRSLRKRRSMASALRRALRNSEMHIHYQPQFDLNTGALTGYEALARWSDKEFGEVAPTQFISIAEENGLIGMLGEWVLQTACNDTRHWPGNVKLSINISAAQFIAQDLVALVRSALQESGLAPERLLLEFTEEVLFRNNSEALATLKKLTGMGVQLAIDNFGTGYSSLKYLTQLPVSKIKIDRSFIHEMQSDKDTGAIVRTIIGLGKSLDLTIAADGVETRAQAQYLRQIGCNEVQGFLFGRPQSEIDPEIPGVLKSPETLDAPPGQAERNAPPGADADAEKALRVLETGFAEPPLADEEHLPGELADLLPDPPAPARLVVG